MRFLVVGAGATGGYFGGRLLEAGRDVTFLVRPARAERLAAAGLTITSPAGNVTLPSPPTVLAADLRTPFDVVILSCKAYDLDGAIESFAPAVGPDTAVVPLLNGMRHLDALDARFGADRVLGGSCFISAKLDEGGRIAHVSDIHRLTFGERAGGRPRVEPRRGHGGAKFEARGERGGRAGDVGEVGVPGGPGRDHVPDAGGGRRHRRGRRRRPGGRALRMSGDRAPQATRPAPTP